MLPLGRPPEPTGLTPTDRVHHVPMKLIRTRRTQNQVRDFPCCADPPERVMVLSPQFAIGPPILISVPRIKITHTCRLIRSVKRNGYVRHMVACCCEELGKPPRDHRRNLFKTNQGRHIRSVIDNSVFGEQGQHGFCLCPVKMKAVGMNDIRDVGLVKQSGKTSRMFDSGLVDIHTDGAYLPTQRAASEARTRLDRKKAA